MTTNLAAPASDGATARSGARSLGELLPGAFGLQYAGVQLDGGIIAAAYRGISTVPDDRLNFPFAGSLATATSLTFGLSQALLSSLSSRSRAAGPSERAAPAASARNSRWWAASCSSARMR